MSALRGFIAGTIAVSTVEVLVTVPSVAGRIGTAGGLLADVIDRVVNPDVPAVGPLNFVAPAPEDLGASTPAQPTQPGSSQNYQGGIGSQPYGPPTTQPRTTLKAKPPRPIPQPTPRST